MQAFQPPRRGRSTRGRRAIPIVVIAIAIVALGAYGWYGVVAPEAAAQTHLPGSSLPSSLTVTAIAGFRFSPSQTEVANGTTITITFINGDSIPHTFSLSSVPNVAIPPNAAYNASGWVGASGTFHPFQVSIYLTPGGENTTTIPAPALGWYEYICTQPGHFQSGMFNALGFGVAAPSNLTGGGAAVQVGWPVYVIAGTIVGLVVLALVLGFAFGQRHGSKYEMPPERLGYPEPPGPPSPVPPPAGGVVPPGGPKPPPR